MMLLETELERLLDVICREWGFCLIGQQRHAITKRSRLSAQEFATEVLQREGFPQPEYEVVWMRRLSGKFTQHFGTSNISADEISG